MTTEPTLSAAAMTGARHSPRLPTSLKEAQSPLGTEFLIATHPSSKTSPTHSKQKWINFLIATQKAFSGLPFSSKSPHPLTRTQLSPFRHRKSFPATVPTTPPAHLIYRPPSAAQYGIGFSPHYGRHFVDETPFEQPD